MTETMMESPIPVTPDGMVGVGVGIGVGVGLGVAQEAVCSAGVPVLVVQELLAPAALTLLTCHHAKSVLGLSWVENVLVPTVLAEEF